MISGRKYERSVQIPFTPSDVSRLCSLTMKELSGKSWIVSVLDVEFSLRRRRRRVSTSDDVAG